MKGYKAFNSGWICRDFQYEIGKTYELPDDQKLEICKCGFHFCKNPIDIFGYYTLNNKVLMAEVEAIGEIKQEGTKYVTDKIKIVKELTMDHLQSLIVDEKYNTGNFNSGNCNSGEYNSGNYNSGVYNSGFYNSGDYNSGANNSGDFNSGYFNFGNYNSGDFNSGDFNSGNLNSGNFNVGFFNSGKYNSGIFNTDEPYMRMFNKSTNIKMSNFINNIDYNWFDLCKRIYKNNLLPEDYNRIKALPNFDADIFKICTGIKMEGKI